MSSTKLLGAALLLSIGVSLVGCAGRGRPTTIAHGAEHDAQERARAAEQRDAILSRHRAWNGASRAALQRQNDELSAHTAGAAAVMVFGGAAVVSGLVVILANMGSPLRVCTPYGCGSGAPGNSEMLEIGGAVAGVGAATLLIGLTWLLTTESTARPLRRLLSLDQRLSLDADVGPDRAALRLSGSF